MSPVLNSAPASQVSKLPYEPISDADGVIVGSFDCKPSVPPNVAKPICDASPGPRSTVTLLRNCDVKNDVEWCVKSFESPNGMPSNVTLYWPSWKPRIVTPADSIKPGPFGFTLWTLGAMLAMSL